MRKPGHVVDIAERVIQSIHKPGQSHCSGETQYQCEQDRALPVLIDGAFRHTRGRDHTNVAVLLCHFEVGLAGFLQEVVIQGFRGIHVLFQDAVLDRVLILPGSFVFGRHQRSLQCAFIPYGAFIIGP